MVDRTGLHTAPVPGNPPLGTAPVDGRLVQAALFGSTGQCLNGGGLTPSSSTMAFTVAAGVYQIPDTANGGAVYHSPVDSAVLTPAAGQSGGRIDSIYVLQQDFEKNATTSRVVYGIAAGTPGSGSVPSLSGIAGGPMRLANIAVPASATKASDCTISWVVPPATLALDGTIAPNKQLLDLVPGTFVGQRSFAGGIDYRWNGAAWKPWDSDWAIYSVGTTGFTVSNYTSGWQWRYVAGEVEVTFNGTLNSGMSSNGTPDYGSFTLPVPAAFLSPDDLLQWVKYTRGGDGDFLGVLDFRDANRVWMATLLPVTRNGAQVLNRAPVSGSVPFTWTSGDTIHGRLRYRAA